MQPGRTAKGDASYRRLLSAAARELAKGNGACELQAIAARARVSVGLPYRYFGSKGGMIAAVVGDFFDRFDALILAEATGPGSWVARERARSSALVDFVYDEPLGAVIFARLIAEPEVVVLQEVRTARLIEVAARAIERGKEEGFIAKAVDAEGTAAILTGGLRQLVVTALSSSPPWPRQRTKDGFWQCTARLLELEDPRPQARGRRR